MEVTNEKMLRAFNIFNKLDLDIQEVLNDYFTYLKLLGYEDNYLDYEFYSNHLTLTICYHMSYCGGCYIHDLIFSENGNIYWFKDKFSDTHSIMTNIDDLKSWITRSINNIQRRDSIDVCTCGSSFG